MSGFAKIHFSRNCLRRVALLAFFFSILSFGANLFGQRANSPWDSRKRLYFPIEKNKVKILPQRFEYHLDGEDSFRIGDALFVAKDFQVFLSADPLSKDRYRLELSWPSSLLLNGTVHLKDSVGKSLWTEDISQKNTETTRTKTQAGYRAWVSKTRMSAIPTSVLQRLVNYPFFQVCVQLRDNETMVSLCSRDFFASSEDSKTIQIKDQIGLRDKAFVEINGQEVDPQGAIFLQNETDFIFLKGTFKSGASIEIQTSLKAVRFIDLENIKDPKRVLIRGMGAVPADPVGIARIGPTTWEGRLSKERPSLFLRGEGGIPLRQEFLIESEGRDSALRIELPEVYYLPNEDSSFAQAGGRTALFKLKSATDHRLESLNDSSRVIYQGNEVFWEVRELNYDELNTRHLKIKTEPTETIAAFDFKRKPSAELSARLTFPLATEFSGRLDPLHSRFSYWTGLQNHIGKAKPTNIFLHRILLGAAFHPRYMREENMLPPYQLGVQLNYFTNQYVDFPTLSLVGSTSFFLPRFLKFLGPWGHIQLESNFGGGRSPLVLKPSLLVDLQFRNHSRNAFGYGLFMHQYNFEPNIRTSNIQRLGLNVTYFYSF